MYIQYRIRVSIQLGFVEKQTEMEPFHSKPTTCVVKILCYR